MDRARRPVWLCVLLLSGAGLCGCNDTSQIVFRPNRLAMVAAGMVPEHQRQTSDTIVQLFGTPDEPCLPTSSQLAVDKLQVAAGAVRATKPGESLGLYRQHCAQCHGLTGDGRGPAAAVLDPLPRDFRHGLFKYKSTYRREAPTRSDLRQVLVRGVPGTSMPSFRLLQDEQLDALVEYVMYLSQRGEVERQLIEAVVDELDYDPYTQTASEPFDASLNAEHAALAAEVTDRVAARWQRAEAHVVEATPPVARTSAELAESVATGSELFANLRANCIKCHGVAADGMGELQEYDDWNKPMADFIAETDRMRARLATDESRGGDSTVEFARRDRLAQAIAARDALARDELAPRPSQARNIAHRPLCGGSDPIDVFRRIHQGLAGTPMPAHGAPAPGAAGPLSDDEIWSLVDYVLSLSPAG